MSQSVFAGMTNYQEQSVIDIKDDIVSWIELSKRIKTHFIETMSELKETGYWRKVPCGFASFCEGVPTICDTFCHDFEIIIKSIENDCISNREIQLMRNIYKCAWENEEYSWRSYKDENDIYWKDYGNQEFRKIETLYGDGRDFFVTLKDVNNAMVRLEDYVKPDGTVVNKIEDNSIHIGDGNEINNSPIGSTITNNLEKNSLFKKHMWEIISGIIVGVAVVAICIWFGLK